MDSINDRNSQQPEITLEYIDQLLSSAPVNTVPEPMAEKAAHDAKAETPAAKPSFRKCLPIILAAALVIVLLCLFLPNVIANLRAETWQVRAEETYQQLVAQRRHHFTCHSSITYDGIKTEYFSEYWESGQNRLVITPSDTGISYEVIMNGHHYQKTVTAENPDAGWTHMGDVMYETISRHKTLAEGDYVFTSVRGTLAGTDVTYNKKASTTVGKQQLIFRFDLSGTLTKITVKIEQATTFRCAEFTFIPTDTEEIFATIKQYYKEATGKE